MLLVSISLEKKRMEVEKSIYILIFFKVPSNEKEMRVSHETKSKLRDDMLIATSKSWMDLSEWKWNKISLLAHTLK